MVDYYNCKMSGSEDEFESQAQTGMTKAELRRSNKPIMEKRRRARINQCLDELKSLILEAMKKDPTRHSKLEKADILEMTVKHLQAVQRQQMSTAVATDPAVLTKFHSGFSECASEVSRYVSHLENVDPAIKQRLVTHLQNCMSNLQQVTPFYNQYVSYAPDRLFPEVKVGYQSEYPTGDENNNGSGRIQIPNGVHLIPSRLPTGELALLVPQSSGITPNFPYFPQNTDASRMGQASAFTAVQRTHSPLASPSTSTSSFEENHHNDQYPHSQSPSNDRRRFKMPVSSPVSNKSFSSPETQKPQISSSSDRKSPISVSNFVEPKVDTTTPIKREALPMTELPEAINGLASGLRQPLSVITDKTYNRTSSVPRRDGLKRHNSEGLLAIYGKRQRCYEAANVLAVNSAHLRLRDEHSISAEDISMRTNSSYERVSAVSEPRVSNSAEPAPSSNGDMWRPW